MAAEEILISYRVEVDQLKAELQKVQAQMKATEASGKSAASATAKEFNKAGSDIKQALGSIAASIGIAFGTAQIISFGKESIKAFSEAEVNANKLKFAVTQIGKEGQVAYQKLIDQSNKLQDISIFSDDDIQKAQTQLATLGLNSKQIEELIPKVLDLASATGQELGSATDSIIQGINGQTRGLRAVGLEFEATSDKTKNLAILSENLTKFQGSTAAALETTAGKAKRLENAFDNLKESVGEYLITAGNDLLNTFDVLAGKTSLAEKGLNDLSSMVLKSYSKDNAEILKRASESAESRVSAEKIVFEKIKQLKANFDKSNNAAEKKILADAVENQAILLAEIKKTAQEGVGLKSGIDKEAAAKALEDEKKRQIELRDLRASIIQDSRERELKQAENANKDLQDSHKGQNDYLLVLEESYRIQKLEINKKYDEQEKQEKAKFDKEILEGISQNSKDVLAHARQFHVTALAEEKEANEESIKLAQQRADAEKEIEANKFNYAKDLLYSLNNISNNITERRLQEVSDAATSEQEIIQAQYDSGLLSRQDYDRRITESKKREEEEAKKIQLAAFKRNKELALINAAINTAESISKTLATYGIPAGIPLIAIAAALGALQVATIASQPTPKFAKGVVDLKGKGTKTSDEIPALLSRGESVITADATATDRELFKAFNKGNGQKYIYEMYVAPALKEQLKKHNLSKDSDFAQNIANSMLLNSGKLNDGNILESLKMQRKADKENIKYLAKVISKNNYNARSW